MNGNSKHFINASQIRAARALINWSQEDLAQASDLSTATVRKIESGHISPRDKTMTAIRTSLEAANIEFTPSNGLRLRESDILMLEGNDSYLQLLDDVYLTLKSKKGEVLLLYADSTAATEDEHEMTMRIKKLGTRWRMISEEGNTYMPYPLEEYRWLPTKFFKRNLQMIYANKVALSCEVNTETRTTTRIALLESVVLAEATRNSFNFMWENCRKPPMTTAPKIYE